MGLPASVSPIIYFKLSIKQFRYEDATAACAEGQAVMDSLNKEYEMLIGWSELYELANIEKKKMIVNALIKRIDVYRGYRVHIDFDQFQFGLDLKAKTA